ncbi:MAG TPA: hypothetical protein VFU21_04470 [Kofleriaceae bacterium]|nr:hypothetical protein [Kofleriaceae bacterium]
MTTRLSILLVAAAGACGRPAPPPVPRAPAPAARVSPPSRRALPGYPPPVEPRAAACVVTGGWPPEQPHELRFRRGGRTFATVNHVDKAVLALGEDPASPFVELSSAHLRMWGVVIADQLVLHPARPILLDGYIAPGPTAVLRWIGADREPAPVEVVLPAFVRPAAPPRGEVRCADLATDEREFDPRAAIDAPDGEQMMLIEKRAVPLAREPDGSIAAELTFGEGGSPIVEVIERRGDQARVLVHHSSLNPAENVLLVGWVPASVLAPHSHGFGGSWGTAGDGSSSLPRPREGWRTVTCTHEVPLVVELEGERHLVGAAASGVRLEVPPDARAAGEDLVEIVVRSRQVEFAEDVRVLARGSLVAACSPALAPE